MRPNSKEVILTDKYEDKLILISYLNRMMLTREHHSRQKIPTAREVLAVQIIIKYPKPKVCKSKTCLIIPPYSNIVNPIHPSQQIESLRLIRIKINNKLSCY